ncbi:hypothetical protein ACHAWF_009466 [Thalassiosira exigua]
MKRNMVRLRIAEGGHGSAASIAASSASWIGRRGFKGVGIIKRYKMKRRLSETSDSNDPVENEGIRRSLETLQDEWDKLYNDDGVGAYVDKVTKRVSFEADLSDNHSQTTVQTSSTLLSQSSKESESIDRIPISSCRRLDTTVDSVDFRDKCNVSEKAGSSKSLMAHWLGNNWSPCDSDSDSSDDDSSMDNAPGNKEWVEFEINPRTTKGAT